MMGAQIRAARALIGWTAQELATQSGVGVATIRRAETKPEESGLTAPIVAALTHALENGGVEFIDENGNGAGVRLCKPRAWRLSIYEAEAAEPSSHESIRSDEQMLTRLRELKAAGKLVRVWGGTDIRSESTLQALRDLGAERI